MRHEPVTLAVGDRCVLLHGVLRYEVEITEVRTILEDEPQRFHMFRVRSLENHSRWFEDSSQHRGDLFKMPEEREALLARIEGDIDALESLQREVEEEIEAANEAAVTE